MPSMNHLKAVAIGELIGPMLPVPYFMSRNNANEDIKKIITYYMHNETLMNRGKTKATYIAFHNNMPTNDRNEDWEPLRADITDAQFLDDVREDFMIYFVATGPSEHHLAGIDLFTTLFVSNAKRENVSEEFMEKISKGIQNDLQHTAKLDSEIVSLVLKFNGDVITPENAQTVLNGWLNDLPQSALRLRLTLEQALGSSMTAFIVVGRAMIKYPDFPWAKLNILTGGELANYALALTAVNGNPYYGFKL